jgi:hypothetical protein
MPPIRVTFFFRQKTDGWSETYYSMNPNIVTVENEAAVLADLRSVLVSPPCEFFRIRISDDDVKRDRLIRTPNYLNNDQHLGAEPGFTSVRLPIQSGTLYVRSLYLRGVPDSAVQQGEYFPNGNVNFKNGMTAFLTELRSGRWGVATTLDNIAVQIATWELVVGPEVIYAVKTLGAFGGSFGEVVQILGGGPGNGINGLWRMDAITAADQFKVRPVGVHTSVIFQPGVTIKRRQKTVKVIDRVVTPNVTHRDQGRPFGQHRGRRRGLLRI